MIRDVIFIALGGALGALSRHGMAAFVNEQLGHRYASGTLIVNLLGSFAIGILYVLITEKLVIHPDWRQVLIIGFLGAFTTFSTFSLDAVLLWENGSAGLALLYVIGSVVCCVFAAGAAITLTRFVV